MTFSFGLIPDKSKVHLIVKRDAYYYSAYVSGDQIIFKSLPPNVSTPAVFSYTSTSQGTSLSVAGKFLATDGRTLKTSGEFHHFTSSTHNLKPNTIYGGIYYTTPTFNPLLAQLDPTVTSTPFGGALSTTLNGGTNLGVQFIPVEVPKESTTLFPTVYQLIDNVCLSPQTIDVLLTDWMKGVPGIGCNLTNPNGCIFTSHSLCQTKYVAPYCVGSNTCGSCVGLCPSTEKFCVYDYAQEEPPFYSCDPKSSTPPSWWDQNKVFVIIAIIIFVVVLIIMIFFFYKIYQKYS